MEQVEGFYSLGCAGIVQKSGGGWIYYVGEGTLNGKPTTSMVNSRKGVFCKDTRSYINAYEAPKNWFYA